MNKYMRIPTHNQNGWLVLLVAHILVMHVNSIWFGIIGSNFPLVGLLQIALIIAFLIEITATILGKNEPAQINWKEVLKFIGLGLLLAYIYREQLGSFSY